MLGWRELRMEEQVYAPRRKDFVDAWLHFTSTTFHNASSGSPYLPLPPNATIGFSGSIDAVIRQPSSTPREVVLEQLHTAFPSACDYILEWHRTVRRELASLLPGYNTDDDDEIIHARLKLATSVFHCTAGRCRGRGRTLAYPEILSHPCFSAVMPGKGPPPNNPRGIAKQKACRTMGTSPWNCSGRIQVHPRQCVVKDILLCCGKDPRSTTAAELDRQNPKLICLECATNHGVFTMMSWHSAVSFFFMKTSETFAYHFSRFNTRLHLTLRTPSSTHGFWLLLLLNGRAFQGPETCNRFQVFGMESVV